MKYSYENWITSALRFWLSRNPRLTYTVNNRAGHHDDFNVIALKQFNDFVLQIVLADFAEGDDVVEVVRQSFDREEGAFCYAEVRGMEERY